MSDEIDNYVRIRDAERGQFGRIVEDHLAELNDVVGYAERDEYTNVVDINFNKSNLDVRFTIGNILFEHGYYISEIVARTDEKTSIPSEASHRLFVDEGQ